MIGIFSRKEDESLPSGVVTKGIGGFYYVKTDSGVYECKARGIFRKDAISPLPGDRVSISISDFTTMTGSIEQILPRDIELFRPAVSNVNQVAIVISIKSPLPDLMLLDKLLLTVEYKNLQALVCINKVDLATEQEYKSIMDCYTNAGYKVITVSSHMEKGFDELKDSLKSRTTVFAGQSGVGKSTILNRILESYVMKTGNVSDKIGRGKHTTRHAELLELKTGGFVLDTPGFSSFELSEISSRDLQSYYRDYSPYIEECRFNGCSHISEPGCGVKNALEKGFLDNGRYLRYVEIHNFLKEKERRKYS